MLKGQENCCNLFRLKNEISVCRLTIRPDLDLQSKKHPIYKLYLLTPTSQKLDLRGVDWESLVGFFSVEIIESYKFKCIMSTASNLNQELFLDQIQCEIFRVAKKDASVHALAIGFSQSPDNTKDSKYTSKEHPNFTVFPTRVGLFAQKQQLHQPNSSCLIASTSKKCVIQIEEYFCMVQDKIQLDTDYHVQSKLIDVIDDSNGKQTIYVNRSAGYLINKKGAKDMAFYFIDVMMETVLDEGQIFTKPTLADWPKRPHDLTFKEKSFRSQSFLYVANSSSNPIHVDPKAAREVGLPRPTLPSKAVFAMMMRVIVQKLLGYDQTKVKQSEMKLLGLVFPGDELQVRVWKEEGRFYLQGWRVERKCKVVMGRIGIRQSAKL